MASQLVVDSTDVFYPVKGFSLVKVGRKRLIDGDKYLDAVTRTRTLSDLRIGRYLGLNRSTIYRFRKDMRNKKIIEEAHKIIKDITCVSFNDKNISKDAFRGLPIINEWVEMMVIREVSELIMRTRLNVLFKVCKRLKTHPEVLSLEQVSKLVNAMRKLKKEGQEVPRGFSYISIRKPIRSFFQLTKGISGELLTGVGIDAGRTKGEGLQAKEKITFEQRKDFVHAIRNIIMELKNMRVGIDKVDYLGSGKSSMKFPKDVSINMIIDELLSINYFMYYTGTRITATLRIKLDDSDHKFSKDKYEFHVLDKGKKGGQHWQKMLIDDGLKKMKEYLSIRFKININALEKIMPLMNDTYLFPFWYNKKDHIRKINKEALKRVGVITIIPCHLFRHTYAQDGLHATNFNYELVASIGGWSDTSTMKRYYGEMSDEIKERGLKRMMGLPVEEITYELRW